MSELEFIKCSLCEKNNEEFLMEVQNTHGSHVVGNEKFKLLQCRGCGLVYLNPRPKEKEIGKFYDIGYYDNGSSLKATAEKLITQYVNKQKIAKILKYKQSGKILDIGCGSGNFLSSVPTDRFELYGVEPNKKGHELSSKKIKGKIFNNKLRDCHFQNSCFDIVSMWHVFEHIYAPDELLFEIKRILKDDGVFVLAVPNIYGLGYRLGKERWFHMDAPRHLYHYSPVSIEKMLTRNGFYVLNIVFPFLDCPLDLFHSLKNYFIKNSLTKTLVATPLLFFSLFFKPITSLLKVGETMIVFCRKGA